MLGAQVKRCISPSMSPSARISAIDTTSQDKGKEINTMTPAPSVSNEFRAGHMGICFCPTCRFEISFLVPDLFSPLSPLSYLQVLLLFFRLKGRVPSGRARTKYGRMRYQGESQGRIHKGSDDNETSSDGRQEGNVEDRDEYKERLPNHAAKGSHHTTPRQP